MFKGLQMKLIRIQLRYATAFQNRKGEVKYLNWRNRYCHIYFIILLLIPSLVIVLNALFSGGRQSNGVRFSEKSSPISNVSIILVDTLKNASMRLFDFEEIHDESRRFEEQWKNLVTSHEVMESDKCEADFGFGLIRRWIASKRRWCEPSITCYPTMQSGHSGSGDNLCVIENAILNLVSYNNSALCRRAVLSYRDSGQQKSPQIEHITPVLITNCQKNADEWDDSKLPGWNLAWLGHGLSTDSVYYEPSCFTWDRRPLLIVQRNQFANFYHCSQDFYNVFLALQITGLSPQNVHVLIADLYPWGPYESLWKQLFPHVNMVWELRDRSLTCYRKIIVGIYGAASPLTFVKEPTFCEGSPLLRAYAKWIWSSFNIPSKPPTPHPAATSKNNNNIKRLLWISRQSTAPWPEQTFCDDRYFTCQDWQHLKPRQIARALRNEDHVISALRATGHFEVIVRRHQHRGGSGGGGGGIPLSFREQLALDASSDVMAGPHGAGLAHLVFLPDHACVAELLIDGSEGYLHYHNLAALRGLAYQGIVAPNPARPDDVVTMVLSACVFGNATYSDAVVTRRRPAAS